MTMTRKDVKKRLESAVDVLDRLWVAIGPKGIRSSWPAVVRTTLESYGWHAASIPPVPPHGREIDEMDEALGWLAWLDQRDQKIVWARLNGAPWWRIAQRFGKSESAVRGWFARALDIVALGIEVEKADASGSARPFAGIPDS